MGIAMDEKGNIFVADCGNCRIRKISIDGNVSTIAGDGMCRYQDGRCSEASFLLPSGIDIDSNGNIFVADTVNHRIRKISQGIVETIAGGEEGFCDGRGTNAKFNYPEGLTLDDKGNIYVADSYNHAIRMVNSSGEVITIAGSRERGSSDGIKNQANFSDPIGVIIDNEGSLYVSDGYKIRKIT